jgi:hypothetical protein
MQKRENCVIPRKTVGSWSVVSGRFCARNSRGHEAQNQFVSIREIRVAISLPREVCNLLLHRGLPREVCNLLLHRGLPREVCNLLLHQGLAREVAPITSPGSI